MKKLLNIILAATISCTALQAEDFLVAAGSSSGTYQAMLKEISGRVSGIISFKEVPSSGAIENLDKLIGNEVSGAFVHSDVLYFRGQSENLDRFKTLIALYPEEVHFVALTDSKMTTGGVMGIGAKSVVFNSIGDLSNARVGAAGGGYITAQVIRLQSQIPYNVIQYGSGKEVMDALNRGEIEAALFVGGAPLPNLKDLGPGYKLLSIPDYTIDRLKAVYRPARVTYTKMSPNAVTTVAADCLFVVRAYKTPKMINMLRQFREAFYQVLPELQETPGTHKKWQQVDPEEHGRWPWLELGVENSPMLPSK